MINNNEYVYKILQSDILQTVILWYEINCSVKIKMAYSNCKNSLLAWSVMKSKTLCIEVKNGENAA